MPAKLRALIVVAAMIFFTFVVAAYRDVLANFSSLGYFGIFLGCLAANSTLFLPAPSSSIVFTAGALYNPFLVGIIGGLGATLGEVFGYLAGWTGRTTFKSEDIQHERFKGYVNAYGAGAIFFFAFLPLPLFDLVGVAAGISRMEFPKFMLSCAAGKLLKMLIYSFAGAGSLPLLFPLIDKFINLKN